MMISPAEVLVALAALAGATAPQGLAFRALK